MHEFEQAEDAILARLQALKAEGLKDLDLYVGQFDVELKDLDALLPRFPCIYVVAGEMQLPESETSGRAKLGVMLFTAEQHVRGAKASIRGDAARPGIYYWLERSRALLHRRPLVAGWRSLRLTRERILFYAPKKRVCIFESLYTTEI